MRRKIWSAKDLEARTAASGGEGTNQLDGGEGVTRGGEGRPDLPLAGGEGTQTSDIRLKDHIERIGTITVGG
jgi:hypothetical protein